MSAAAICKPGFAWPKQPGTRELQRHLARHRVKVIHSGSSVKVSHAFIYDCLGWDSDSERDALRSMLRAKEKLIWRCIALGADRLLTLTYRENVEDLEQSKKHLRLFWKIIKRHIPDWKFVGVAEYQKRGAVHWHLAVTGWQNVQLLRRVWLGVLEADGLEGNIDVTAPDHRGRTAAEHIGGYIAKYLAKGFETGDRVRYSHYYVTSRGLVYETTTYTVFGYTDDEMAAFVEDLCTSLGGKVRTRWRSYGNSPMDAAGGVRTW